MTHIYGERGHEISKTIFYCLSNYYGGQRISANAQNKHDSGGGNQRCSDR